MTKRSQRPVIPESVFTAARRRIGANLRLRRTLPPWGRLHVDRQVPFLVVYRRPSRPDAGTVYYMTQIFAQPAQRPTEENQQENRAYQGPAIPDLTHASIRRTE